MYKLALMVGSVLLLKEAGMLSLDALVHAKDYLLALGAALLVQPWVVEQFN